MTEFGVLETPLAIVSGEPLNAYAVPNPGGQVLGLALTGDGFPLLARSYFSGSDTWYWLVQTTDGQAWLPQTDGLALYGITDRIPVLSRADAFALERSAPSGSGVISPPPPAPIPDAPTAPDALACPRSPERPRRTGRDRSSGH